jgi:hypothetical protein
VAGVPGGFFEEVPLVTSGRRASLSLTSASLRTNESR